MRTNISSVNTPNLETMYKLYSTYSVFTHFVLNRIYSSYYVPMIIRCNSLNMDPLIAMYSVQSSSWFFMECVSSLSDADKFPYLWRYIAPVYEEPIVVLYIKTFKAFTHLNNFKFRQLETFCFIITKIPRITHSNNTKPLLRLATEIKISSTFN